MSGSVTREPSLPNPDPGRESAGQIQGPVAVSAQPNQRPGADVIASGYYQVAMLVEFGSYLEECACAAQRQ